jgi:hypothetical protein
MNLRRDLRRVALASVAIAFLQLSFQWVALLLESAGLYGNPTNRTWTDAVYRRPSRTRLPWARRVQPDCRRAGSAELRLVRLPEQRQPGGSPLLWSGGFSITAYIRRQQILAAGSGQDRRRWLRTWQISVAAR